jgi:hypothetical protein
MQGGRRREGVGLMKDKNHKLEDLEVLSCHGENKRRGGEKERRCRSYEKTKITSLRSLRFFPFPFNTGFCVCLFC